jgi:hypothetical protein
MLRPSSQRLSILWLNWHGRGGQGGHRWRVKKIPLADNNAAQRARRHFEEE